MHLLVTQPGEISDGTEAVDLGQSPGDIVILSAAASDLSLLAEAYARLGDDQPSLRLANLMQLGHNMSVDVYVENTIARARLVIVRLLGGLGYWPYGIEQIQLTCRESGAKLAVIPGDDQPDPELTDASNVSAEACHRIWQYSLHGGLANAENLLRYAAGLTGDESEWLEPAPLVRAGLYWPEMRQPSLDDISGQWSEGRPTAALVFYRALVQASDLAPVDALINALNENGLNALPLFVGSLKDPVSAEIVTGTFSEAAPDIILNCTGFAVSSPGGETQRTPYTDADCPVMQVILSGGTVEEWQDGARGLAPRDLAMNVALPEVDGRLISRAVSFKKSVQFDEATEVAVVKHEPVPNRVKFVAELAAAWARLRRTPPGDRKVAVIVANYPNKDGRLGNGVGLDTPAGVAKAFEQLTAEGYDLGQTPPAPSG